MSIEYHVAYLHPRFEGTGEGSQWSNLFKAQSVDNDLTVGHVMLMLLVSAMLYLLIALYVEQIRPGDYGVPRPWYFPVTRTFWLGNRATWTDEQPLQHTQSAVPFDVDTMKHDMASAAHLNDSRPAHDDFDGVPPTHPDGRPRRAGIRVRDLRKTFGATVAVHGLNVDFYEDDISVLLGHNGAGKTTTMSMLTGMLPPSGGTAHVNGHSIRTDIADVRSSVGLCPQHNILFDDLTVGEHIAFYARLKGVPAGKALEAEVDRYVDVIQLAPKRNVAARALSGGMKRKLSVCVALCGGSRVVFCDEPSSGMDPAARRALWEVLRAEKHGRTVLLSTHFMDEADVLGDRVAIMNGGRLVCCGSPYFLKRRFGAGYRLVCAKSADRQRTVNGGVDGVADGVLELLRGYDAEVRLEADSRTEVTFVLSERAVDGFEQIFGELERDAVALGVLDFGVSLTTLEEVFLRVGTDGVATEKGKAAARVEDGGSMVLSAARRRGSLGSVETVETVSSVVDSFGGSEVSCE